MQLSAAIHIRPAGSNIDGKTTSLDGKREGPRNAAIDLRHKEEQASAKMKACQEEACEKRTEPLAIALRTPRNGVAKNNFTRRYFSAASFWERAVRASSLARAAPESIERWARTTPSFRSFAFPPATRAAAAFISTMSRLGPSPPPRICLIISSFFSP